MFLLAASAFLIPEVVLGGASRLLQVASVKVEPPFAAFDVGSTRTVSVKAYNVENMYSGEAVLTFDPTVVQVVDVDPSTPGVQIGIGVLLSETVTGLDGFVTQTISNTAGTIEILFSYSTGTPAFTGSGELFSVMFAGAGAGNSALDLEPVLSDPFGVSLLLGCQDGALFVSDGTPTATPTTTATPSGERAVVRIAPSHAEVHRGYTTTVDIEIADVENLHGAEVHLSFDPALVQVVDSDAYTVGMQVDLGDFLQPDYVAVNSADNASGRVDLAITQFPATASVTGTGRLASVVFYGAASGVSPVAIDSALLSDRDGIAIPSDWSGGEIDVIDGGRLVGQVTFEGRSSPPALDWSTPLSVTLWVPGDISPTYEYAAVCDETGVFTVTNITTGTYHVKVRDLHSLWNVRQNQGLVWGTNTVDMGMLIEGDADGSGAIDVLDFSLLATSYNSLIGDPDYDPRVDFNNSRTIDVLDFSLLATHYGEAGENILSSP